MAWQSENRNAPQDVALRLKIVEETLKNLQPPEGGDLTAITAAVNKLYNYTLLGSQYSGDLSEGITYEDTHWFNDAGNSHEGWYSASIVSVTYGGGDSGLNRVKNMALIHQLFAGSANSDFAGDFAAGGTESQYYKSLFGSIWGSSNKLDAIRARGSNIIEDIGSTNYAYAALVENFGSVLGAIYRGYDDEGPFESKSIAQILSEILQKLENHEVRINNLEWP